MKRRLVLIVTMGAALVSATASAETLGEYVDNCKADLGFGGIPALNCNGGVLFAPQHGALSLENDYVGYAALSPVVDLTFACRWLRTPMTNMGSTFFTTAASVEMLIHNRQTGHTCFFAAKNPTNTITGVSTVMVPPDDPDGGRDAYWMQPAELDAAIISDSQDPRARLRCVGCHAAGPYIASPRIAPFLARFGLLNNGHDTIADMIATTQPHYHAVGSSAFNNPTDPTNSSAFKAWDSVILTQLDPDQDLRPDPVCSGSCHSIAIGSTVTSLIMSNQVLIPPITADIAAVANKDLMGNVIQPIMPPTITYSDYRWVNVDTPNNVATGDTGDIETLQRLQQVYPSQWPALACSTPTFLQAHVVGSDVTFDTSIYQDKLHTFNLRDGLTCLSAEQTNSHACLDYQTRYKCPTAPTPTWTSWINSASTAPNDHEERTKSNIANAIVALCGSNVEPIAIQARFTIPGTTNVVVIDGPPDRLAQFDKTGLKCNNVDQGVGKSCSNYVVRFVCPLTPGVSTLTTRHFDGAGQQTVLTQAFTTVDLGINNQNLVPQPPPPAPPVTNTQQWTIEPVTDFSNSLLWTISVSDRSRAVRLRNAVTGHYATTNDVNRGTFLAPYFWLLAQQLRTNWTTQIWIKEPVPPPFESSIRLRTAWLPGSKSVFQQLYMTLTTTKNGDTGTQDVFIKPVSNSPDGTASDLQSWRPLGIDGPP